MLKLIKNEFAKIFYKKTTYVIILIGILLGIGLNVIFKLDSSYKGYDVQSDSKSYEDYVIDYKDSSDPTDKANAGLYEKLISLGFHNETEMENNWKRNALNNAYTVHQFNIFNSEKEKDTDKNIDLEKETFDLIIKAVDADDYKQFYEAEIAYYKQVGNSSNTDMNGNNNVIEMNYFQYCLDHEIVPDDSDWRYQEARPYLSKKMDYDTRLQESEQGKSVDKNELTVLRDSYMIIEYRLDHNIENSLYHNTEQGTLESDNDFISSFLRSTYMCTLVAILMAIIAGGSIANEFSSGTIKFLLINPVKRVKIFWSKYITCIAVSIMMLLFFFVFQLLVAIIINGGNGVNGQYIYIANEAASSTSVIWYIAKQYLLASTSVLTTVTLAFTISSLLRSSSVAIALSLGVQLAGSTIVVFLSELGQDWGRYLLFANTNLSSIIQGNASFPNQSLTFALINIAVYMVIFLLTAYDGFIRREV